MSFILDALRKSESERQRDAAPVLARAPLALVRRETPVWSWVAIGLLSLALAGIGTAWWLRQPGPVPDTGTATPVAGTNGSAADPASGAAPTPAPTGSQTRPAAAAGNPPAVRNDGVAAAYGTAAVAAEPRPIEDLHRMDPSLPEYRLSLLASEMAYIDGRRYAPGQRIGDGPEVLAVRPDGVVLGWRGESFLLPLR